jgi:hypothetical protein
MSSEIDAEIRAPDPTTIRTMARYGIINVPIDSFRYRDYCYANLKDAIAQAERDQLGGASGVWWRELFFRAVCSRQWRDANQLYPIRPAFQIPSTAQMLDEVRADFHRGLRSMSWRTPRPASATAQSLSALKRFPDVPFVRNAARRLPAGASVGPKMIAELDVHKSGPKQRIGTTVSSMRRYDMQIGVSIGQKWSAWVPGRGQWLLSTVVSHDNGKVILRYDERYGVVQGHDEQKTDEDTMLANSSLFRLVEAWTIQPASSFCNKTAAWQRQRVERRPGKEQKTPLRKVRRLAANDAVAVSNSLAPCLGRAS